MNTDVTYTGFAIYILLLQSKYCVTLHQLDVYLITIISMCKYVSKIFTLIQQKVTR